ncbi:MAG: 3-dehydroquinate synthase [Candidatus Omnitrophica bacterium]|nr:3-dehydroquinate synthase [Candidatus Omnitrophota bacterium]
MRKLAVQLGAQSYPILIGRNLLNQIGAFVRPLKLGRKVLVVSNQKVARRFLPRVARSLGRSGYQVFSYHLSHGDERDKSEKELSKLWSEMAQIPLDRTSTVLALGGGVVGDLAGFAASTFMRGVSLVQVPTTLLAQVDSAVGGKTGIDLPGAKNMIGAFYQPRIVISDVETLRTIPLKVFKDSLAEVIKYGMIQDRKLFELLEQKGRWFIKSVKRRSLGPAEIQFLEEIVWRSALVKAKVVEEDERETKGKRMILNYGHTFAHALEAASGFKMAHGEAVACGMILAGELALKMGFFSIRDQARQISLIKQISFPAKYRFSSSKILELMKRDKKVRNGKLRFVLPRKIGKVDVFDNIPEKWVRNIVDHYRSVR